jgi:hypothetical protein
METQQRIIRFVRRSNWFLYALCSLAGVTIARFDFALGILCGGLIATANYHLLSRTLTKAFTPPRIASPNAVLSRYAIRFGISGLIIFFLIAGHIVNPIGLLIGLSVVVASIMLATLSEVKKLIFKEAF